MSDESNISFEEDGWPSPISRRYMKKIQASPLHKEIKEPLLSFHQKPSFLHSLYSVTVTFGTFTKKSLCDTIIAVKDFVGPCKKANEYSIIINGTQIILTEDDCAIILRCESGLLDSSGCSILRAKAIRELRKANELEDRKEEERISAIRKATELEDHTGNLKKQRI